MRLFALAAVLVGVPGWADPVQEVLAGNFRWRLGPPVLTIDATKLPLSPGNPWYAVKDPSIVYAGGAWHLFATLRKTTSANGQPPGSIRIGYMTFADWGSAQNATWTLLDLYPPGDAMAYHGAPQVFFFTPQNTWYLIYQWEDPDAGMPYGAYYSTTTDIADPHSWSLPQPLHPPLPVAGLDHWVICDSSKAYHFFTNLNGSLYRAETPLASFPSGWSTPVVALTGTFLEASHTYLLKGQNKYLTFIDAIGGGSVGVRYQQAFVSDTLGGTWAPLAATTTKSFAGVGNVLQSPTSWTNTIDHGELIRTGYDERLEADPAALQFLFQGAAGTGTDFKLGLLVFDGDGGRPDAAVSTDGGATRDAGGGGPGDAGRDGGSAVGGSDAGDGGAAAAGGGAGGIGGDAGSPGGGGASGDAPSGCSCGSLSEPDLWATLMALAVAVAGRSRRR